MPRRAPPEYYEEDIEIERSRDAYAHPRPRSFEEDEIDFRRRRSIPPVAEMDRLDIRARPRDFMRESFAPPRERAPVLRRSRDDVDQIPEEEGDMYVPPRERRRYRPREVEEEEFVVSQRETERERRGEREKRGDRRRRSERDLVDEEVSRREWASPRGYESDRDWRGRFDDEEEIRVRSGPRRRSSRREEEADEYLVDERERERERERARRRQSRDEPRFDRRKVDEVMIKDDDRDRARTRRRRSSDEREVEEELIIDEREPARPRDRGSHGKPRLKEEIIMNWKDRPSPGEVDEDEILFRETRRRRRSSPEPEARVRREPPGSYPEDREDGPDEEIRFRSRIRPRRRVDEEDAEIIIRRGERDRRHREEEEEEEIAILREQRERDRRRAVEEDEELVFRRKERDLRRASLEDDEIMFRKSRRRSPSRERSPSLKSIHAPPIHQDIVTHHRHIDHGYVPPRAPSPEIPSTRTSFDEVDVDHRTKHSHKSEEDVISKYREEDSVSPTSGPSLEFNNPWEADRVSSRSKPKSVIDDEIGSIAAKSSRSRTKKPLYREIDLDIKDDEIHEKIIVEESRSTSRSRPRSQVGDLHDTPDEWSVVHAPSKDEEAEMSGALNVVEIAPKGSMNEEVDGRVGAQVSKERRDERWTEITKDLVVREAIERLGYEFEETRTFYYIFSFMEPGDIDELVHLSDEIRQARRRRIREMQRERDSRPPRPASWADRAPPRPSMGPARRMREREWFINTRT